MGLVTHLNQKNVMGIMLWEFQVYASRGLWASIVTLLETKCHKKKPELDFLIVIGYKEREREEGTLSAARCETILDHFVH